MYRISTTALADFLISVPFNWLANSLGVTVARTQGREKDAWLKTLLITRPNGHALRDPFGLQLTDLGKNSGFTYRERFALDRSSS